MILDLLQNLTKEAAQSLPGIRNPSRFGVRPLGATGVFKTPPLGAKKPVGLSAPKLTASPAQKINVKAVVQRAGQIARTGATQGSALPGTKLAMLLKQAGKPRFVQNYTGANPYILHQQGLQQTGQAAATTAARAGGPSGRVFAAQVQAGQRAAVRGPSVGGTTGGGLAEFRARAVGRGHRLAFKPVLGMSARPGSRLFGLASGATAIGRKVAPVAALGAGLTALTGIAALKSPLGPGTALRLARPQAPGVYGAGMRNLAQNVGGGGFYGPAHTVKGSRVRRVRTLTEG